MSHSSNSSYLLTHPVPHSTFHILPLCELNPIALPQRHCASSSSSRPMVYLFFLAGPGPLPDLAVSAFSRSPLGRANTSSFLSLLLTRRISLKSCTVQTSRWTAAACSSFPPISVHTFSTTLSHLSPARPFATFSHTALSGMAGNLFLGMLLT